MQETFLVQWYNRKNHTLYVHSLYTAVLTYQAIQTVFAGSPITIYRIRHYEHIDLLSIVHMADLSNTYRHRRYVIYNQYQDIVFSTECSKFSAIAEYFSRTTILIPIKQRSYCMEEVWQISKPDIETALLNMCSSMVETGRLYQAIAQIREYA